MRITVASKTDITEALEVIKNYLEEKYSDYPMSKGTINIYFDLKNNKEQICPDNEKAFKIQKNANEWEIHDMLDEVQKEAIDELIHRFGWYIKNKNENLIEIRMRLNNCKKYLETAEEKKRKPENIKKHEKLLESYEKQLNECKEECELLSNLIKNHGAFTYRTYWNKNNFTYEVLEAYIIMKDIDGFTGYFDGQRLCHGELENE